MNFVGNPIPIDILFIRITSHSSMSKKLFKLNLVKKIHLLQMSSNFNMWW